MQQFLDWLVSLPVPALYGSLALIAAIENIFPPVPADTVVAFGSFLAARGQGTLLGAFLSTWIGNVAGAMLMYWLGRRLGAHRLHERLAGTTSSAELRMYHLYGRFGLAALFLSRFLPGVRAVVPPFAGALRVPALPALVLIAGASAIWYGAISVIAFRLGTDWERVLGAIGEFGRTSAIVAAAIAALGVGGWFLYRRRGRAR